MNKKGMWILVSTLLVLGLLAGVFGCAAPAPTATTTPTTTPTKTTPAPTKTTPAPTATTPAPSPTAPEKITLKWQDLYFLGAPYQHWPYSGPAQVTVKFKEFMELISDGQVEIEILAPGAVVGSAEVMKACGKGIVDGACVNYPGFYANEMPEANVEIGLPFAWQSPEEHWDAWNYYGLKEEFQKIYQEEYNVYTIDTAMNDIYHFGTTFPVDTPDAIKGKKIRALGIYGDYVQALGGSPVVLPAAEIYMGLKLGTIDGTIYGLSGLEDLKLKEVWKYYVIDPNTNSIGGGTIINYDKLMQLPERVRELYINLWPAVQYWATFDYHEAEMHMIASATKEGTFTPVTWSAEDKARVYDIGIALWDTVAAKSERCKRLVDMVKQQARDLGRIE